jgi:hypothetical protein
MAVRYYNYAKGLRARSDDASPAVIDRAQACDSPVDFTDHLAELLSWKPSLDLLVGRFSDAGT